MCRVESKDPADCEHTVRESHNIKVTCREFALANHISIPPCIVFPSIRKVDLPAIDQYVSRRAKRRNAPYHRFSSKTTCSCTTASTMKQLRYGIVVGKGSDGPEQSAIEMFT